MTRAWQGLDAVETPEGHLELRRRGEHDFLILLDGRVIMNSAASRSEEALGARAAEAIAGRPAPRVLLGGLGMGFTLRAALDALPADATVRVAELNGAVIDWCRGPLAPASRDALADPRVTAVRADLSGEIASADEGGYDAIVLDLFEGPHARTEPRDDPFYGSRALARSRRALAEGGVLAVWCEDPERGFERRLLAAGFTLERARPGRGGRRHAIYLARA